MSDGVEPRAWGERIEQLLDASASGGPIVHERAEELVRLVVELYGAGLERALDLIYEAGGLTEQALASLAGDSLVSSLLLVHGLHPYGVEKRVEDALTTVRPYMGSHGGDVKLIGVSDDGVVTLQMLGSCEGCPSSSVTLKLAVEGAIEAAAPEVTRIDVVEVSAGKSAAVIPVTALSSRLRSSDGAGSWHRVDGLVDLGSGSTLAITVDSQAVLICRIGKDLYAYRDSCATCSGSFSGAVLERGLGTPLGTAVLTCPACHSHFDIRKAGAGTDSGLGHLSPLPLLESDDVVQVAIRAEVLV